MGSRDPEKNALPARPDNNGLGGRGRHWHNQAAIAAMPGRRGERGPTCRGRRGYGGAELNAMDREEEGHSARHLPRRVARPDDHG